MVTGIFHYSNIVSGVKSFPLIALFCFHIAWKHHLCLRAAPEKETVPLFNLNDSFGEVMETTVWSRINICQRLKKKEKEKKKIRAKIVLTLKIRFANYINTAYCMLKVAVFARINLDMLISKHTDFKLLSVRPWMKADTVWYMVLFLRIRFCLFWRDRPRFRSNNETVSVRRADEEKNFGFSASYFQTANKEAMTWSVVNHRCCSSKWSFTTCFSQDEKMQEGNKVLHVKWKHSTRTHREVTTQELASSHWLIHHWSVQMFKKVSQCLSGRLVGPLCITVSPEPNAARLLHNVPVVVVRQPALGGGILRVLMGWREAGGESATGCPRGGSALLRQ